MDFTHRSVLSHYLEPRKCEGGRCELPQERKKRIHDLIARSESFEHFMQAKFPDLKRYMEDGESLLDPLLSAAARGVSHLRCTRFILKLFPVGIRNIV